MSGASVLLCQPGPQAFPALLQLVFELGDLGTTPREQVELAVDVPERLVEDLAAAVVARVAVVPLLAQHAARLLDFEQLLELVEADAEQRLEPQRLAQALDVGVGVEAMASGLALLPPPASSPISS